MSTDAREGFLGRIEEDLAAPVPARRSGSGRRALKSGLAVGALAASAVLSGFGGVASAESMSASSAAAPASCSTPDPIPRTQSKWCNLANFVFAYEYDYSPNGGIVYCYVFDLTVYNAPCGGTVHVGEKEACA
ncbi:MULTISPECIES: hypothetical protein [unclassified Amycolatopsis]|uniref:hypothetical protein n=1 Tax=unclassified Amycolatopsis TaxID=2618356 RepID=UPI001C6A717F|nr:hypothetical protein [Amycolatopsis sp. DSM 110486]QYN17392.1 hypothetical protein K1T34_31835 [Amycolatopsis sp. DSM 110486]